MTLFHTHHCCAVGIGDPQAPILVPLASETTVISACVSAPAPESLVFTTELSSRQDQGAVCLSTPSYMVVRSFVIYARGGVSVQREEGSREKKRSESEPKSALLPARLLNLSIIVAVKECSSSVPGTFVQS